MYSTPQRILPCLFKEILKLWITRSLWMFLFCNGIVQGQQDTGTGSPLVTIHVNNKSLRDVLFLLEQQIPYKFAYNTELVALQKNISIRAENKPLDELFPLILKRTNISYSVIDNQIILNELESSGPVNISGYVRDSISGEALPGAIIYLPKEKTGTYTNDYGFFSIPHFKADTVDLLVSYIGFKPETRKIKAHYNTETIISLAENKTELKEVLITDKQDDDNIRKYRSGEYMIPMGKVNAMAGIVGKGDLLYSLPMYPGILAGMDGRPGYFVRGGNTDQNLILLDEATIYNPGHLLGLAGIFNSSAVKSARLLKSGFPASYGDHLSSVLDVTMKEGNNQYFSSDLEAGTVTSGLTLSGPVIRGKASFLVSARRSTMDLLWKPFQISDYFSNYHFYDVNLKFNIAFSTKDRFYASFYRGRDYSSYSRDTISGTDINYRLNYGNQALTFRWNHVFSPRLFTNTSISYTRYFHEVHAKQQDYYAELNSGIRDMEFKTDIGFYPGPAHRISAGLNFLFQTLYPSSATGKLLKSGTETLISPPGVDPKYSNRFAAYAGDEIMLGSQVSAYLGIRLPFFHSGSTYIQPEPRLALMYMITPTMSLKAGYSHMHQYLHLVQSFNSSFPAQIWTGSGKTVKPQFAEETSLGLHKNMRDNMFQTSIEFYYKRLENQLMFRGGTDPSFDDPVNDLVFGRGKSYGAEIFISKNRGNFTGWIAYTLAYSNQQFDSLNMGKEFPFANDRRHSLAVILNQAAGRHWVFSSSFLFTGGSAFTVFENIAPNKWIYDNPLYYYSGDKDHDSNIPAIKIVQNNYRLAPYHRLDVSIRYNQVRQLMNRRLEIQWVFSVYNVYARKNTFFAYCSIDPVTKKPVAVEVSSVPVIPSISYLVKF